MASLTEVVKNKRKRRQKNAGHKRKIQAARASTKSYDDLFAACGEPGKAAPKNAGK
jgi:hypothetical protein